MAGDWRDDRIAELESDLAKRDGIIAAQSTQIAGLLQRVAVLEEQLRKSSQNSSKPPSSDGPAVPARPKKPASGRKRGGQRGHKRNQRDLVPVESVREIVECIPERCRHCDERLHGSDPEPIRHQVTHLPPIVPITDEYRQHRLSCDQCDRTTVGELPAGVPTGAFGPSVVAVVAVMMGAYRQSKRLVPDLLFDLFGLRMSVGAAVGCQHIASSALEAPVMEARKYVTERPVKHADETGWREGATRARAWLWVVVTASVAVFMVHLRRNADAAKQLLVAASGVLVTDRHGAYNWWPDRMRQFCWAHLSRDFQTISERSGDSKRIGGALLEETHRLFHFWHRARDGTLKRATLRVYMRALRARVKVLLTEGAVDPHPEESRTDEKCSGCEACKTSKTCKKLLSQFESLWTFVRVEGVEPTNNAGEQILRHGVIMRKLTHGTHSERGSRFVERILTVHGTLRLQKRNVLDFVRQACEAALHGAAPPSLLPVAAPPAVDIAT